MITIGDQCISCSKIKYCYIFYEPVCIFCKHFSYKTNKRKCLDCGDLDNCKFEIKKDED